MPQDYIRLRSEMKQEALDTNTDKDDLGEKFGNTDAVAQVRATCKLLSSTASADEKARVVDAVLNLASNPENRAGLVDAGVIPMLIKLRRTGNAKEKDAACKPRSPCMPACLFVYLCECLHTCMCTCLYRYLHIPEHMS